jgi:hypothetical protein
VPHPGTAILSAALLHLSDRWKAGGIYIFPCPPQRLSLLSQRLGSIEQQQVLIYLSSIGALQAPNQNLREKAPKLD